MEKEEIREVEDDVLETILEPSIPEAIAQSVEATIAGKKAYIESLKKMISTTTTLAEIEAAEADIRELQSRV